MDETQPMPSCKRDHASHVEANSLQKRRKITIIISDLPDRLAGIGSDDVLDGKQLSSHTKTSPQDYLASVLSSHGIDVVPKPYTTLNGFFVDPTEAEINAYGSDVLNAIRGRNIAELRSFLSKGRPLKCSNQFGESLLHLACRRGFCDIVKFLVEEAGVPLCVKDDYGRTPLHDAFWTTEPQMELVDFIINQCPDLLYVTDRRGNTPLSFIRMPNWEMWVNYLKECSVEKLVPRHLSLFLK